VAYPWSASTSTIGFSGVKAPKNGYVYVYVSNRSDQSVYFDNLLVGINGGNIIEENHYYAFGLKIAAISSKKLGDAAEGHLKNSNLYNDKELFDDGDLNWYDYGFRNYDPQIGRFVQLDPLTDDYPMLSPYQYAGNDPIANVDLDGLEPGAAGGVASGVSAGERAFTYAYKAANDFSQWIRPAAHVATAAASGVTKDFNILHTVLSSLSIVMQTSIATTRIINTSVTSSQAGNPYQQGQGLTPFQQGELDALVNANLLGALDLRDAIFSQDPLNQFDNAYDRQQYINGRAYGNGLALAQSFIESNIGRAGMVGGASTGVVAVSAGGAVLMLHGTGVSAAATADMVRLGILAMKHGLLLKASSSKPSSPQDPQKPGNGNPKST
jgi:RHS repeat-associated protein